jgi:hypothetical protein
VQELCLHAEAGEGVRGTPVLGGLRQRRRRLRFSYRQMRAVRSRCRGGVPCMQRRSREGEERSTATFSLVVDLPKDLASSGGGSASAARWRDLVSEREWEGGRMGDRRGFPGGSRAYNCQGRLGLVWVSSEAIGRRGRCLGTESCTESRGEVIGVGGWPVRSQWRHFQSGYGGLQAWPDRVRARGCWVGVALRRCHCAVLVCVKRGVRRGRGARERDARSGRTGRPDRLASTWSGQRARSRSRVFASGNRSIGSWQAWR